MEAHASEKFILKRKYGTKIFFAQEARDTIGVQLCFGKVGDDGVFESLKNNDFTAFPFHNSNKVNHIQVILSGRRCESVEDDYSLVKIQQKVRKSFHRL